MPLDATLVQLQYTLRPPAGGPLPKLNWMWRDGACAAGSLKANTESSAQALKNELCKLCITVVG